jgi:hypothetical protein
LSRLAHELHIPNNFNYARLTNARLVVCSLIGITHLFIVVCLYNFSSVNCELFLIFNFFTLPNVNNYLLYKYINIKKVKSDAKKIKLKYAAEIKMIGNDPKQKKNCILKTKSCQLSLL